MLLGGVQASVWRPGFWGVPGIWGGVPGFYVESRLVSRVYASRQSPGFWEEPWSVLSVNRKFLQPFVLD